MMKKIAILTALGLALALDAGMAVAASDGGSIAGKLEELGKPSALRISDLRAVRRDNLLRIQAEVTNTSSSNQQLYYRFKWLDDDGFVVWEEEPWKPLIIYGLQKVNINAVSPSFKATDFRIQLQSPNNDGASSSGGSSSSGVLGQ